MVYSTYLPVLDQDSSLQLSVSGYELNPSRRPSPCISQSLLPSPPHKDYIPFPVLVLELDLAVNVRRTERNYPLDSHAKHG